jgi:hypothetical protein
MRLIDADALCNKGETLYMHTSSGKIIPVNAAPAWVINNATTIDAVPVTRCKDCKHWGFGKMGEPEYAKTCAFAQWIVGANGYCVYGEVKNHD